MPNRPFAYNTGSPIPGCEQIGDLAIGKPTDGYAATGLPWWGGPDEEGCYIIAYSQPNGLHPTPDPNIPYASLGFVKSANNDAAFIAKAEEVSQHTQDFESAAEAKSWLNANGYWTSFIEPINGSVQFTSSPSQYLSIPNNIAFTQNQAFTIETWFYPTDNAGGYVWAMLQQNFLTVRYTGNKFVIDMSYVGNPPGYTTLNTTYPINDWYHLALVWDGTNGRLFVNGVIEWTFTGAGALVDSGNPLLIGQYQGQSQPTPLGYISNFRVVKGTAVYTSAFTPPTSPLTAISGTQLLLNTYNGANFLQDTSINNFTVTNTGSVTSSTTNPFGFSSSITIATNDGGGLNGWNSTAFAIAPNPLIGTTYPVGSQILFQNGEMRTIVGIDDYSPLYMDIFYDSPISSSTLFPITIGIL